MKLAPGFENKLVELLPLPKLRVLQPQGLVEFGRGIRGVVKHRSDAAVNGSVVPFRFTVERIPIRIRLKGKVVKSSVSSLKLSLRLRQVRNIEYRRSERCFGQTK